MPYKQRGVIRRAPSRGASDECVQTHQARTYERLCQGVSKARYADARESVTPASGLIKTLPVSEERQCHAAISQVQLLANV